MPDLATKVCFTKSCKREMTCFYSQQFVCCCFPAFHFACLPAGRLKSVDPRGIGQKSAKTMVALLSGFIRLTTLARPAKSGTPPFDSLCDSQNIVIQCFALSSLFCGPTGNRTPNSSMPWMRVATIPWARTSLLNYKTLLFSSAQIKSIKNIHECALGRNRTCI